MIGSLRYSKRPDGTWTRLTLAFMFHTQWCNGPGRHVEHGLCSSNRRTRPQALPPRNFHVWPIFEEVSK
jgi:hypothetical protein